MRPDRHDDPSEKPLRDLFLVCGMLGLGSGLMILLWTTGEWIFARWALRGLGVYLFGLGVFSLGVARLVAVFE